MTAETATAKPSRRDSATMARRRERAAADRRQRLSDERKADEMLQHIRVRGDALDVKLAELRVRLGLSD